MYDPDNSLSSCANGSSTIVECSKAWGGLPYALSRMAMAAETRAEAAQSPLATSTRVSKAASACSFAISASSRFACPTLPLLRPAPGRAPPLAIAFDSLVCFSEPVKRARDLPRVQAQPETPNGLYDGSITPHESHLADRQIRPTRHSQVYEQGMRGPPGRIPLEVRGRSHKDRGPGRMSNRPQRLTDQFGVPLPCGWQATLNSERFGHCVAFR